LFVYYSRDEYRELYKKIRGGRHSEQSGVVSEEEGRGDVQYADSVDSDQFKEKRAADVILKLGEEEENSK
jgi:hypothetical protein